MKNFKLLILSAILLPFLFMSADSDAPALLKWNSIAFGQSTDLNFSSTIIPEKVGVNNVTAEVPGTINGKITLESRGGKIARAHDGITFYYTVIDPVKYNFVLEADIKVDQFGPLTEVQPNNQTSCGLMVRDANGIPRKEPMVFGFEELPAASNLVLVGTFGREKTRVNINAAMRNGIFQPWGSPGSDWVSETIKTGVPVQTAFKLKLERTNTGFTATYSNIDGSGKMTKEFQDCADIVQVMEKDKMYVGFYAARNVKMTVSNAKITLSPASTGKSPDYRPPLLPQYFEMESSDGSQTENYMLSARSGYSGTLELIIDGKMTAEKIPVRAGEAYNYNVQLKNRTTDFEVTFYPSEGPGARAFTRKFTVEYRKFKNEDIVAGVDGKPEASGTYDDPVDIATAVKFAKPGGNVYLKEGVYPEFTINRLYSGLEGKLKKISPYGSEKADFSGLIINANYLHIYRINATGSKLFGFRINGSGNKFELCRAYENGNTGFHMYSEIKIDKLKSSNNIYINCDAFNNTDPTMENADGFAVKGNCGKGNIYRGCMAYNNADDGWDLFNNIQEGPNEPVVFENCIAYRNGFTTRGESAGGFIGNGFKLGGEGQPVNHVIRNSIAFQNRMDGFTCNFNPGTITVENCTSFDNSRFNYIFRSNPYIKPSGVISNSLSVRIGRKNTIKDFVDAAVMENNSFYPENSGKVTEKDFMSLKAPQDYKRDRNGDIIWGNFLRIKPGSPLFASGKNGACTGTLKQEK